MRLRRQTSSHPGAPSDRRSITRIMLAGGLWNQLTSILPMALNIVITPYVIHGFGIARWGLFVLVTTIVAFLGPLNGGLGGAAGRYFAVYAGRDDRKKTTETLVTLSLALLVTAVIATAIGWFVSPLVIRLFSVPRTLRPEGVFLLRTMTLIIAISFLHNLFGSVLNSRQRYALTNLTYTATYFLWTAGLLVCVHQHLGLRGVAYVFLLQQALSTVLIVPSALRYLTRSGVRLLPMAEVKEIGRYALSVQGITLVGLINNEVDSVLIGGLFSVRTLAFYNSGSGFALNLREILMNAMGPISTHLAQVFGRDGDEATEVEFRRLQRLWVIGSTGWSAVGLGSSYFAVVAWLGPDFKLAGEVAALSVGTSIFYNWTNVLSAYISAVGRPDLEVRFTTLAMVINIALTVPGAIFAGALGVTAATGVATVFACLYLTRIVRRRYRTTVPSFFGDIPIIPGLLAAGFTASVEYALQGNIPSGVTGLLICGVPAFFGLLIFAIAVLGRDSWPILRALRKPRTAKGPVLLALLGEQLHPPSAPLGQPTA